MDKLLQLLDENATYTPKQLAAMLEMTEADVKAAIEKYENEGVILAYKTIIDWDKTDREFVNAIIEVKITPKHDFGFDKVAEKLSSYPEVRSLYLMSGVYDLAVIIEGRTIRDIAYFVTHKLSTIEDVQSCSTHFVLRTYKDKGITYGPAVKDERGNCL